MKALVGVAWMAGVVLLFAWWIGVYQQNTVVRRLEQRHYQTMERITQYLREGLITEAERETDNATKEQDDLLYRKLEAQGYLIRALAVTVVVVAGLVILTIFARRKWHEW